MTHDPMAALAAKAEASTDGLSDADARASRSRSSPGCAAGCTPAPSPLPLAAGIVLVVSRRRRRRASARRSSSPPRCCCSRVSRGLPPRSAGAPASGRSCALRPRQHLPAHRRHLHAVHAPPARRRSAGHAAARSSGAAPLLGVVVPGLLDRRAALALHPDLRRARLGGGLLRRPTSRPQRGAAVLTLMIVGGRLYTLGRLVYGLKRPDPFPRWFGFHEVFHTLHHRGLRRPLRGHLDRHVLAALTTRADPV